VAALTVAGAAQAQQWSGVLDPQRAVDWSQAGVPGGIPARTTVCTTLSAGASSSQINSAIANCPANQVVYLNAGTYNLSSGIDFNNKSNVTLRGAGPTQTILNFSGGADCVGIEADICVANSGYAEPSSPPFRANWTGGLAKGSTTITLSSTSGLTVGQLLILDQLNESSDTGNIWNCSAAGTCSNEGPAGGGRNNRSQLQVVRVTGISGNNVTIDRPVAMPNYRSSQSPGAWAGYKPVEGVGVEDLRINNQQSGANGIVFLTAYGSWVRNVTSTYGGRAHVWVWLGKNITVRDSYFYEGNSHASQSYGVELFQASDVLVENNIVDRVTAALIANGPATGSVIGYNYVYQTVYATSSWMIPSNTHHATGVNMILHEGNDSTGWMGDNVHGPGVMLTMFRNRFTGSNPDKVASSQTIPIQAYHYWRYLNVIGNVLGDGVTQKVYECNASTTSAGNCGSGEDASIYVTGWSGNGGSKNSMPNDPKVGSTMMRWGNWDTVNNATRFNAAEVPSGISPYANAVPSSQALPASFYRSSRPSWWGNMPWPAIGPDVSGGDVSGTGGHVYKIPARLCYENTSKTNGVLNFNANNCYAGLPRPKPPTAIAISN
jgi:hypothetical protein